MASASIIFALAIVVGWAWFFAWLMKKGPSVTERRAHVDRVREVNEEAAEFNDINSRRFYKAWNESTVVAQERDALHTYLARPITLRLKKTGRYYKEAA